MRLNHSLKNKIKGSVIRFYADLPRGLTFRSEEVLTYVKKDLNIQYIYPDTVFRYARELRNLGKINYICTNKRDRIIQVL